MLYHFLEKHTSVDLEFVGGGNLFLILAAKIDQIGSLATTKKMYWSSLISFVFREFCSHNPLVTSLGGHQSQSARGSEKNELQPMPSVAPHSFSQQRDILQNSAFN
jgi:hypothetical protein